MKAPSFIHTYIGYCCREWVLALGGRGRCGLCGEKPTFLREDDRSPVLLAPPRRE